MRKSMGVRVRVRERWREREQRRKGEEPDNTYWTFPFVSHRQGEEKRGEGKRKPPNQPRKLQLERRKLFLVIKEQLLPSPSPS